MAARKKTKATSEEDRGDSPASRDDDDEFEDDDESDDDEDDDFDDEDEEFDEDDDDFDDEDAEAGDLGEHEDARAAGVAKALGLGDEAEAEEEADEAPKNRAARRAAERAQRRGARRGKRPADEEGGEDGDKPTRARDRNKRLREQLLARRRDAAAAQTKPVEGLAPSEMAEDVLVRAGASVTKWLGANKGLVGWSVLGALVITAGVLYYVHRSNTTTANAADLLARAVNDDQSLVLPEGEDPRTEEQKEYDPRKFFPSADDRSKAALAGYDKVKSEHGGSAAAILAELGRAGVLLDQLKYDEAISAYEAVLATELAPVDADVQARALEGTGFAKEAKKDAAGAEAAFKQLEAVAGFKGLGLYHRARLLLAQDGKQEDAKKLLVEARKIVDKDNVEARAEGSEGPNQWLLRVIEERLRLIDPSAVPAKPPSMQSGPGAEQLRRMLESRGLSAPPQLPRPPGGAPQ